MQLGNVDARDEDDGGTGVSLRRRAESQIVKSSALPSGGGVHDSVDNCLGARHVSDGSNRRVALAMHVDFLHFFSPCCSAHYLDSDIESVSGWGGSVGGDVPMDSPRQAYVSILLNALWHWREMFCNVSCSPSMSSIVSDALSSDGECHDV